MGKFHFRGFPFAIRHLFDGSYGIGKTEFGLPEDFRIYTLRNGNGLRVKITNFGAAGMKVHTPNRDASLADVALGFGDCAGYLENVPSFGVVVGRYS